MVKVRIAFHPVDAMAMGRSIAAGVMSQRQAD